MTDRDLPLLPARVERIGKGQGKRVEEYRRSLLEGYAMLA
jgi:hypothetical protein